ncbi:hypothetical protein [Kibdelosporangium aridum]|uniref:hypothetical protein n=1 Tax=Kibdelosporangium aridum TaxID=2030 RepID=UPI00068E2676
MSSEKLIDLPGREFRVWTYAPGHSTLLLRSGKESSGTTRIDVVFMNVGWLNIPIYMNGLVVERPSSVEVSRIVERDKAISGRVKEILIVRGADYRGHLIAGAVEVDESDRAYNEIDKWEVGYWVK